MKTRLARTSLRHRRDVLDTLEPRRLLAAAPYLSMAQSITVPAGKNVQIPLLGSDADGDAIRYSVSGGSTSLHPDSNPWLELATGAGTIRFQLFADFAPGTVRKIRGLVDSGFYDGTLFTRSIVSGGFRYAQGGAPSDGSGGPGFTFDDEFHPSALFTGGYQLATANVAANNQSGKDANGSQFFVTGSADSSLRSLDFNHTIFGQLVRGEDTVNTILSQPVGSDFNLTSPVTISSARIVENKTDAVLQINGAKKPGTTTITVTATDETGRETSRDVAVTTVSDAANNTPPVLLPINNIVAKPGDTLVIPVNAFDLEGDDYEIAGTFKGDGVESATRSQIDKTITLRLADNAKGPITLSVGVKGVNAVSRGGIVIQPGENIKDNLRICDSQTITIALTPGPQRVRVVPNFTVRPQVQLNDALLATFEPGTDDDTSASDFAARIDWGDGVVSDATSILALDSSGGRFAIYGSHAYDAMATFPLTLFITADGGATAVANLFALVAPPVQLVASTVSIVGTDNNDEVRVSVSDDVLLVVMNGSTSSYPLAKVTVISAGLNGGDDLFVAEGDGLPRMLINGNDGNDTLSAGSGDDTVYGDAGDDQLGGNGGNDFLWGGDGNDSILTGSGKNYAYGEDGNDRLTGSGGRDQLYGGDGSDRLYGRAGGDYLDGGGGTDRLYGEDDDDTLVGGSSNDRLYGGDGDDLLYGKAGSDTLDGGPGTNRRGDDDENDIIQSL